MKTKKWYESSTLWINLLGIVTLVLELTISSNLIPDPEVVTLIVAVLNIINRFRGSGVIKPIEKTLI